MSATASMEALKMNDIFGRQEAVFGGAFSADSALMTFAGITGVGLITQQLNFSYQQHVTRIYEVGTHFQYYIVGRSEGSMSLSRVLGPRPLAFAFYTIYGNACNAANNTINLSMAQGCVNAQDAQAAGNLTTLSILGVLLQNVGFSIQAEQMLISEQAQAMFIALIPPAS
jgi:hypothetical protein